MEEANHHIFDQYVDVILMKVVGKDHWDKSIRLYQTVSKAEHKDRLKFKACITPGSEAFVYLLYENCFRKWDYMVEKTQKNEKMDKVFLVHMCVHTTCTAGQNMWGGWTEEGRVRFQEIKKKVIDARARDHVEKMEQECLQRLRAAHQVDAKGKKKRKRDEPMEIPEVDEEDEFA